MESLRPRGRRPALRRFFGYLLAVGGAVLPASPVCGHEQSISYTKIVVSGDRLETRVSIRPSTLNAGFDLSLLRGDLPQQIAEHRTRLFNYLLGHVQLTSEAGEIRLDPQRAYLERSEDGGQVATFVFAGRLDQPLEKIGLRVDFSDRLGPAHVNFAQLLVRGRLTQAVLKSREPPHTFAIDGPPPLARQGWQFVRLGASHIFHGYDHILFLLALIVGSVRLLSLLQSITAFTAAHSLTLILSALKVVNLPSRLTESAIALSIIYVAAQNLRAHTVERRWLLTFFFGLVHGFGFANALQETHLPTVGLVVSLLSFNVGVEIGQLCILAVLFPPAAWMATHGFRRSAVQATSSCILLFGVGWLIERTFNLGFMPL